MKSFIYIVIATIIFGINNGCKNDSCISPCSSNNTSVIEREVEIHDTYKPWWAK